MEIQFGGCTGRLLMASDVVTVLEKAWPALGVDHCIGIMAGGYAFENTGISSSEESSRSPKSGVCPWFAKIRTGKRMGAASLVEIMGQQGRVIKDVIGGDASRTANIMASQGDPLYTRPDIIRAESPDQPVLQALGRRMPAILHACFT